MLPAGHKHHIVPESGRRPSEEEEEQEELSDSLFFFLFFLPPFKLSAAAGRNPGKETEGNEPPRASWASNLCVCARACV